MILLPLPKKDMLDDWAAKLTVVLRIAFDTTLAPDVGEVTFFPTGVTVPFRKYLECDGTTYPTSTYPALAKLLGESSPGNFDVPTIAGPTGTVAVIRT